MKIEAYVEQSILLTVSKGYAVFWEHLESQLRSDSCSVLGAIVLIAIWSESRAVAPSELAKALGVGRSNISQALRKLERKRWISRKLSTVDARSYRISISPSGKQQALSYIGVINSIETRWEKTLGKRKAKEIVEGLRCLVKHHDP